MCWAHDLSNWLSQTINLPVTLDAHSVSAVLCHPYFAPTVAALAVSLLIYKMVHGNKVSHRLQPICDLTAQTVASPSGDPDARVCAAYAGQPLIDCMFDDAHTLYEVFRRGARVSNNGPCLGRRQEAADKTRPYHWITYHEVISRSEALAAAFVEAGLEMGQGTCVGIYAKNRPEWVIVEQATYVYDMINVPLYDTLGPEACAYIVEQSNIKLAVVDESAKAMKLLDQKPHCPSLTHLVVMDAVTEEVRTLASQHHVTVYTFAEFEARGKALHNRQTVTPPKPSSTATICYTSGTTGMPKGVIMSHRNMVADSSTLKMISKNFPLTSADVYLSFLPLAHMFERVLHVGFYSIGGSVGFFSGDVKLLTDDFGELRPTVAAVVPRVLNRIYQTVHQQCASGVKKHMLAWALKSKTHDLLDGIIRHDGMWDKLIFGKIRAKLGGRLKIMVTGAAPISGDVLTFCRCAFGCVVIEGYGQTECSAAATITLEGDHVVGSVGVPIPCCEVKLVDVADMDYFAKNNQGEVCIRGLHVFSGYHKLPEKTAEALDKDGWLHTGDVGEWTKRGTLKIIDRKKNILKLAQGEYVSPEKSENVYTQLPLVAQVYVHGESIKSSLVAVVVPDQPTLAKLLKLDPDEHTLEQLCAMPDASKHVLDAMTKIGKIRGLHSFEQVKAVYLSAEAFSVENDLLTPTLKAKRAPLYDRYKKEIDALFGKMDDAAIGK